MVKKSLKIKTGDTAQVGDKLTTTKWWFNGAKKFFTVKVLPKLPK